MVFFQRHPPFSLFVSVIYIGLPLVRSSNFIMDKIVEQRVCLKFCVLNEMSCADALKLLQKAYGNSSISETQAYE